MPKILNTIIDVSFYSTRLGFGRVVFTEHTDRHD